MDDTTFRLVQLDDQFAELGDHGRKSGQEYWWVWAVVENMEFIHTFENPKIIR